jgi:aspartate aminotransferase
MKQHLSDTIQRLAESATLAMARKSRELREKGVDVISLSLGEPDFNTPDFIKDAAKEAIDGNFTSYPPVNGYLDLRQSICHKFKRDNDLDFEPDQIVVSTGAKQSIANVVMAIVSEGEEVILPAPYWVSYEEIIKLARGIPKWISAGIDREFKISGEMLEAAVTEKTRMMIFSTPCNPSGAFYSKEELTSIAEVMERHEGLYVVCDEIYEHINFTGKHESLAQFDAVKDRVITVNGVSKAFAMTGWRIGYIGAAKWIAQACSKIQGQVTSGASGISQKAAKAAVSADPSAIKYMADEFAERRTLIVDTLSKVDGLKVNNPGGAFYLFPEVSHFLGTEYNGRKIETASDLTEFLLEEVHLALVPGEAFGSPGYLRISYAASKETLTEAMSRFVRGLQMLRS